MMLASMMTLRENLLRAVHFDRPDFIPMTFHISDACWNYYPADALEELQETHPLLFPHYSAGAPRVVPQFKGVTKAGCRFTDPWGCVWETTMDGLVGTVVNHPLEDWAALESFIAPDPNEFTHFEAINWSAPSAARGPSISQTCIPNGEIGHNHTWLRLCDLRGYENTIVDMAEQEARIWQLLEMLEHFNLGLIRNYQRFAGAKWMCFSEDLGMQQGPMLSPNCFRTYIKPSYERLFAVARAGNCVIHVHADGDLRLLIDDLLECGIDIINLQDRVNGLEWIKSRLAGKVCIQIDVDRQHVTVEGTPQDIDRMIREEIELLGSRDGGLMMIYGLYPGVSLENVRAIVDAMERYAHYYS